MQAGVIVLFAGLPISQVVMHIGLGLAIFGTLLARPPMRRMPGFSCALALSGWIAASILYARWFRADAPPSRLGMAAGSWLALYCCIIAFHEAAPRRLALRAAAVSLCAAALLAILQFIVGWDNVRPFRVVPSGTRFGRVSGFFGGGLTLGVMAACLGLAFCRRATAAAIGSGFAIAASIASAVAVMLGFSRMAWVALALGIGAGITAGRPKRFPLALGASGALIILGAACMQWVPFGDKMFEPASDGRWIIWKISAGIVADHPIMGAGGGQSFQAMYSRRWHALDETEHFFPSEPTMPHAHNSFLAIAAEYGVPALALFMLFLFTILRGLYRLRLGDREAWSMGAAVFVAWMTAGQFNDLAGQSETAFVFYAVFGLCLAWATARGGTAPPRDTLTD